MESVTKPETGRAYRIVVDGLKGFGAFCCKAARFGMPRSDSHQFRRRCIALIARKIHRGKFVMILPPIEYGVCPERIRREVYAVTRRWREIRCQVPKHLEDHRFNVRGSTRARFRSRCCMRRKTLGGYAPGAVSLCIQAPFGLCL